MLKAFVLTILVYFNTNRQVKGAYVSLERVPRNLFALNKPTQYSCTLPPYPDNGSYIVVEEPSARPGDGFQEVTLVRYKMEDGKHLSEIKVLTCSYGEWFEKKQQKKSEFLYFNATSCPLYCPGSLINSPSAFSTMTPEVVETHEQPLKTCGTPPYSQNTDHMIRYEVKTEYGHLYNAIYVTYSCSSDDVILVGKPDIYCFNGIWNDAPPKCIEPKPISDEKELVELYGEVMYNCMLPRQPKRGGYVVLTKATLKSNEDEESRQVLLRYTCSVNAKLMGNRDVYCIAKTWSSKLPTCNRCGLASDVTRPSRVLPWHAGIYNKRPSPYNYICGGSIIATNLIVSAAHCFWSEADGLVLASTFAVAAGKAYPDWDDVRDGSAMKSNVSDIAIPTRFRGRLTNLQDDIALVFLTTALQYNDYVVPLCIDFDTILDEQQMKPGVIGRIVLVNESVDPSPNFQVKEVPYMDVGECITNVSPELRPYITSDKICAGVSNGTSLCRRDSGSGLAVPAVDERNDLVTYYLRGVFVPPNAGDETCGISSIAPFTDISAHAQFLKFYLDLAIW